MSQTTNGSLALNQAEKKVIVIAAAEQPESMKLRVAAYCRVSSSSEDQLNSFAAQNHYYTSLICSQENWHLVDVYADEGITGTSVQKRSDFQRLLADCRKGKIDRILVKSLSRFARNTKECLETIRELKALGVTIQFEKEHIDTATMSGEMTTAIYAAFAQGESESISKNMRWSYQKRMQAGSFVPPYLPYGYVFSEGTIQIQPEQAAVVRRIFLAYLSGESTCQIAKNLREESIPCKSGKSRWDDSSVRHILRNEKYTGNSLWQKYYTTDTLPYRSVRNDGTRESYYAAATHEGIVSEDVFGTANQLLEHRGSQITTQEQSSDLLHQYIWCGECGSRFRRKVVRSKQYYVCAGRDKYRTAGCTIRQFPTWQIQNCFLRLYYKLKHSTTLHTMLHGLLQIREHRLLWSPDIIAWNETISQLSSQSHTLAVLKEQGLVDSDVFIFKSNGLAEQLRKAKQEKERCLEASDSSGISITREMLEILNSGPDFLTTFDEELFCGLIEKIIADSSTCIRFRLRNGLELSEQVERTVR